jgi:hypothetical protein
VGVNNQLKIPSQAKMTISIKDTANITVVIGLTLIPIELSSKNLIKPAPPKGIGAFPLLLFLRLD